MSEYNRSNGDYSGVLSCMTYRASHFSSPVHPVRIYGAGDLALAYVRQPEGDDAPGRISARALVWPEKAICGRVYGPGAATLRGALRAQGFKRFDDCALVGARLLAIPADQGANAYVMPYIDGYHYFTWDSEGDGFVISDSGFSGGSTHGIAYVYVMTECDHCGDEVREDETCEVSGDTWCRSCASEHSTHCEHCGERSTDDHSTVIVGTYRSRYGSICNSEETWCQDCCDNDATFSEHCEAYIADSEGEACDHCREFFRPDDLRDFDARRVCADCHADLHPDDDDEDAPEAEAPAAPDPVPAPEAPPASRYGADVPRAGCPCHICQAARRDGLPDREADGSLAAPVRTFRAIFGDGTVEMIPAPRPWQFEPLPALSDCFAPATSATSGE